MPHWNSKPKIKIICKHCGKSFEVYPFRKDTARFCSRKCLGKWRSQHLTGDKAANWQGGKIKKTCLNCGKSYFVFKCFKDITLYCSKSCHSSHKSRGDKSSSWKGGPKTKACPHCGEEFLTRPGDKRRKFCSRECHDKWRSIHKSGSNSHAWQGGLSFEPYPSIFNRRFKRMIRERDNHTCAICGKRGKCVHHIDYRKNNTTPTNCITLCRSCHSQTNSNRKYWRKLFTKLPL